MYNSWRGYRFISDRMLTASSSVASFFSSLCHALRFEASVVSASMSGFSCCGETYVSGDSNLSSRSKRLESSRYCRSSALKFSRERGIVLFSLRSLSHLRFSRTCTKYGLASTRSLERFITGVKSP